MKYFILSSFLLVSTLSVAQNKTEKYIALFSDIAISEMNMYNIPASITLAQAILESGNGESYLAVSGNNHFGIKCHDKWEGQTITADDDEKGECFRKYKKVFESYRDHSLFLSERNRYKSLFLLNKYDYKGWAKGLKKAGYATNPKYHILLIDLIEKYNLDRFDNKQKNDRKFYFSHSYGLPYLTSIGGYYFNKKSLYSSEINTSFVFSEMNLGYHKKLLNNFFVGLNSGIIYIPINNEVLVPQLSLEINYKRKAILFRLGTQFPLSNLNYEFIPYIRFTYLIANQ